MTDKEAEDLAAGDPDWMNAGGPIHTHEFSEHCGMPGWTICQCGVYGPETQDILNGMEVSR